MLKGFGHGWSYDRCRDHDGDAMVLEMVVEGLVMKVTTVSEGVAEVDLIIVMVMIMTVSIVVLVMGYEEAGDI